MMESDEPLSGYDDTGGWVDAALRARDEPEPLHEEEQPAAPSRWPLVPEPPSPSPPPTHTDPVRFSEMREEEEKGRIQRSMVLSQHPQPRPDSQWVFQSGQAICIDPGTPSLAEDDELPFRRPWKINEVWVDGAAGFIGGYGKGQTKSATAYEFAVSLATGSPLYGLPEFQVLGSPEPTIVIQTENDDTRAYGDLRAICDQRGVDRPGTDYVLAMPQRQAIRFNLMNEADREWLRERASAGYRYLILDPLYDLIQPADISDRSGNMTGILSFLTELRTLGLATIYTGPLRASALSPRSIFGSTYQQLWLECALFVRWDDARKLYTVRRNAVRDGYGEKTYKLRGRGTGSWEFLDAAEESPAPAKHSKEAKSDRQQKLRALIEADPTKSVQQYADLCGGVSTRTVERDLRDLGIDLPRDTAYPGGRS
jgi:AAA domain